MYSFNIKGKAGVHKVKQRLRDACDDVGVRLGNDDSKVDYILTHLLGFNDINELYAFADNQPSELNPLSTYALSKENPLRTMTLTGGPGTQHSDIMNIIKSGQWFQACLANVKATPESNNKYEFAILLQGDERLLITSAHTMERESREIEVFDIASVLIKNKVRTSFIPELIDKPIHLVVGDLPTKSLTRHWREFVMPHAAGEEVDYSDSQLRELCLFDDWQSLEG